MKNIVAFVVIVCMVPMAATCVSAQTPLLASSSQVTVAAAGSAGDDEGWLTVKPSISVGLLWNPGNTDYSFELDGPAFFGITDLKYDYDPFPAVYLSGRLPFTFGERLEVAISGSWAIPTGASDVRNDVTIPPFVVGRTWDTETNWVIADLRISYALVKDFYFLKALAPVGGLRYDYWKTEFDSPRDKSVIWVWPAPTDTADFYSSALVPYFGLEATIGGLEIGAFGGDLKLSVIGGWTAWGEIKHEETLNNGGQRLQEFDGALDSSGYLLEVFGEYTLLSLALTRNIQGALSLFVKYSMFSAEGEVDGQMTGITTGQSTFDFEMDRSAITGGLTAALTF